MCVILIFIKCPRFLWLLLLLLVLLLVEEEEEEEEEDLEEEQHGQNSVTRSRINLKKELNFLMYEENTNLIP